MLGHFWVKLPYLIVNSMGYKWPSSPFFAWPLLGHIASGKTAFIKIERKMIKKICDRCGQQRFRIHQNSIDSLDFEVRKSGKDPKKDSLGNVDSRWRFRICPVNCSLCRKCIDELYMSPYRVCGNWADAGDYPVEAYNLVQCPEAAKVHRFNTNEEYEAAAAGKPVARLSRLDVLRVLDTEDLSKPVLWEYDSEGILWPKKP